MLRSNGWSMPLPPCVSGHLLRSAFPQCLAARDIGKPFSWPKEFAEDDGSAGYELVPFGLGGPVDVSEDQLIGLIREPISWYLSFWSISTEGRWGKSPWPLWDCEAAVKASFPGWVRWAVATHPGWYGKLLRLLYGPVGNDRVKFICTPEYLNADVLRALECVGVNYTVRQSRVLGAIENEPLTSITSEARWEEGLIDLIADSEAEAMERYCRSGVQS